MRIFHCDHCEQLVFFENVRCVACNHALAYLPDVGDIGTLEPAGGETWRRTGSPERRSYRLCTNSDRENVCNWAVPADDPQALCQSCRLVRVIPDLSRHRDAWSRLEVAKRRLVYSLMRLGLPVASKQDDPARGLAFEFLADPDARDAPPVLTGHTGGVITISVAEADDAQREQRRLQLHEPYRTLLGHFRHEIGHYYWDRLIAGGTRMDRFRSLFGDERASYQDALTRHYERGAPADWQQRFVSAYASVHPWEDWAETWAHYLHMTDSLETAAACGLMLSPRHRGEPSLVTRPDAPPVGPFDRMVKDWFPLTYVLNNLNRGLGLPDGYPFVLSSPAIEKLRFVHETVEAG